MSPNYRWRKEPGLRVRGSRPLDSAKVQAPGAVRLPGGGVRLFYTAVGPAKPFANCQGYILSATSEDGLTFRPDPGIRIAPRPEMPHMSLRVLAPAVAAARGGGWRMYFEARGSAARPTVICSAVSMDLLQWELEAGIRIETRDGVRAPRYLPQANGGGRLFFIQSEYGPADRKPGGRPSHSVASALSSDGLHFTSEPGYRLRDRQGSYDAIGLTAGEVIPPAAPGDDWLMVYSAWQDVPAGTVLPPHPSRDPDAETNGQSQDFAAASIASDLAGYRSRIFAARSADGLTWSGAQCLVEGGGPGDGGVDAIHAEDMALLRIDSARYRMYYAACDRSGNWGVASAIGEKTGRK